MKRTKARDITGNWVDLGDKILRYDRVSADIKCTHCKGTDINCPICHGKSMELEVPIKWYQLVKKLKKLLKKIL